MHINCSVIIVTNAGCFVSMMTNIDARNNNER